MSDQYFEGPVGQVAAGNIINIGTQDLWQCDLEELRAEFARCRRKLADMRRALLLNLPLAGLLITAPGGALLMVWLIWNGRVGLPLMFLWMAIVTFCAWRLELIRRSKGKMVAYYRARIEVLDLILQDRAPVDGHVET